MDLSFNATAIRLKKKKSASNATTVPGSPSDEHLYCICRKPDNGKWMIGCDFCDDWFHGSCIGMNETKAELVIRFACPLCIRKGQIGTWRRKCRLPHCSKAIAAGSKYCSEEHGRDFLKSLLGQKLTGIKKSDFAQIVAQCDYSSFKHLKAEEINSTPEPKPANIVSAVAPEIEHWQKRLEALRIAKDRTKKLNEQLAQASGVKKRDICGFDFRLLDDRWEEPEYFNTPTDDSGVVCSKDRRKCLRHTGWNNVMVDEANLHLADIQSSTG